MTVVAQIDHSQNPTVVTTVVDYGGDDVPKVVKDAQQATPPGWVDVTNVNPRPGPGWTFDGTNFAQSSDQINQAAVLGKVHNAISSNLTFMAAQNPTAAQQLAQLKSLTAQVNALARIATGQFDAAT